MRGRASLVLVLILTILASSVAAFAEEASLRADELRYDPTFQQIRAKGEVSLQREGLSFRSDEAEAFLAEGRFRLWGGVTGRWEERNIDIEASSLRYAEEEGVEVVADGDVLLRRGDDELYCAHVTWRESGFLHLSGGFSAFSGSRTVEAEEAVVEGKVFKILGLKRFEDVEAGFVLHADRIEGRLEGGRVAEATALGGVEAEFIGADGTPMRLSGSRALYSEARGTLVLSGSTRARQGDRTLEADSLVLHLASRRIEAVGSPKITFILPDRGTP
ncbi:MAG: hypothetical protein JMJ93_06905 [Synergistaceae bacterium]|nr:hypothetical protein [Synergistaceae bacterium]